MPQIPLSHYHVQVRPDVLTLLTGSDPAVLDTTEATVLAQAAQELQDRFDTATLLAAAGLAARPQLCAVLVDLVLYHLYGRGTVAMPLLRVERHRAALHWLKGCATGELPTDFPPRLTPDDVPAATLLAGSNPRTRYFLS